MRQSKDDMLPYYIKSAVIGCIEAHDIQPTQRQIDRALEVARTMEKQADGLFMFGWELTKQLLKIVEVDNNIPWEQSALNFEKEKSRESRKRKRKASRKEVRQ